MSVTFFWDLREWEVLTRSATTCLKLIKETLEPGVKYVQS